MDISKSTDKSHDLVLPGKNNSSLGRMNSKANNYYIMERYNPDFPSRKKALPIILQPLELSKLSHLQRALCSRSCPFWVVEVGEHKGDEGTTQYSLDETFPLQSS